MRRSAAARPGSWAARFAIASWGAATVDLDVVVDGDPGEAARAIAREAGRAACFALSEEFGAWRVSARDSSWQIDVESLRGGSLDADLALRDFTVNAIAEPIAGGAPIDPLGGLADLAAGRLRMAGPGAFREDPLRVLRLVRVAVELGLEPEPDTLSAARAHAGELVRCSPERVFVELRRIVAAREVLRGLELMSELGATEVVFPELEALRGVEQSRFHDADVYGHTLEVLRCTVELSDFAADQGDAASGVSGGAAEPDHGHGVELGAVLGEHRRAVAALLAEPLADGLTRGEALRWGALLHDAAKPLTRGVRPGDGRVTFIGHDERGAALAREVLGRLRTSERLRAHVAALVRHHLRLGFLVHEPQPLSRRTVYSLPARDGSGRGGRHAAVDRRPAGDARRPCAARRSRRTCAWPRRCSAMRCAGVRRARRDRCCAATSWRASSGSRRGRAWGQLLEALAEAQFAGEVATREQALARARTLRLVNRLAQ